LFCGGFVVILEDQVLMLVVAMKGFLSRAFQLVCFTLVQDCAGSDPNVWALAEAVPIHLEVQLKKFLGIGTERPMMWWHQCPWNPLDSRLKLECLDKFLFHESEYDEAYEENLVEQNAASWMTEIQ
jgi:hypothetical protein